MRFTAFLLVAVAGLTFMSGCGDPAAKPPAPEDQKKIDDEMRKTIEKGKKAK